MESTNLVGDIGLFIYACFHKQRYVALKEPGSRRNLIIMGSCAERAGQSESRQKDQYLSGYSVRRRYHDYDRY